jgi:predicted nucleic acid-binding protein
MEMMAVDYGKTHWDMNYVLLAERLSCQWLTADEKFFQAVPQGFPIHLVLRLADLRQS